MAMVGVSARAGGAAAMAAAAAAAVRTVAARTEVVVRVFAAAAAIAEEVAGIPQSPTLRVRTPYCDQSLLYSRAADFRALSHTGKFHHFERLQSEGQPVCEVGAGKPQQTHISER
eukprot:6193164-Pleurochrysis_carterae.AAC.1